MATTFTIFFDGHRWVGVLEQHDGGRIRAVRVVFGREPSGAEIEDWLRRHGNDLIGRAAAADGVRSGRAANEVVAVTAAARRCERAVRSAPSARPPGRRAGRTAPPPPSRPSPQTGRHESQPAHRVRPPDAVGNARRPGRGDAHAPERATEAGEPISSRK